MKTYSTLQLQEIPYDQTIAIRGFLYKGDNEWILSDDPQLKSCCIGKKPNQILVVGDIDKFPNYPVVATLEGKFLHNGQDMLVGATVIEQPLDSSFWIFFMLPILIFLLFRLRAYFHNFNTN